MEKIKFTLEVEAFLDEHNKPGFYIENTDIADDLEERGAAYVGKDLDDTLKHLVEHIRDHYLVLLDCVDYGK